MYETLRRLLPAMALAATPVLADTGGLLRIDPKGEPTPCPLKNTDVKAEISGFVARVTVTQEYHNPLEQKIEAMYIFPLPQNSAVDDMTLLIGERTVKGTIKRREEARKIYEEARSRGQMAGLLDQERPNVFMQSVANIPPKATVKVVISYVETLKFEEGRYEFGFPMVVGPRYIPQGLPNAERISPPVAAKGTRAGHDISIQVKLDAGLPIEALQSPTHEVAVERPSHTQALIRLSRKTEIPNKDFLLRYDISGKTVQDAVIAHRAARGGFLTLMLQPPERVTVEDVTPKELVFVIDTSGSMMGFPIEKAKETMKMAIAGLYPRDTFNLISFAGDTHLLFPEPVPATLENVAKAQQFLAGRRGSGGTEMMKAIRAALEPSGAADKIRIVCFMTDGYVGNDREIIDAVKTYKNARVFSFGIGSSVNRFLLDKMAEAGRGEVEYVGLQDDGSAAARRFHERVRNPLLTDVTVEFAGLPVTEVYPKRIPDLFSAKPVLIHARYGGPVQGVVRLRGKMSSRDVVREVKVNLPASEPAHDTMATLWARAKIDGLMADDWSGNNDAIKEQVTKLGLDFKLMTQYTSFVAVEEKIVTEPGKAPRRIEVPVEMPEGVAHEGIFGDERKRNLAAPASMAYSMGGMGGGVVGGIIGGVPGPTREARPQQLEKASRADLAASPGKLSAELSRQVAAAAPGDVIVEIWLTDATPQVLESLKKAGFVETKPGRVAKIRIGRIAVAKLMQLAQLPDVLQITAHKP
ncbi:MAG: VIT and VWA domain-containing protein [Bryobacteraceae bacterium]|nr:VIT and VWA domain-containing protein [Bryobacteraceae bacterium]